METRPIFWSCVPVEENRCNRMLSSNMQISHLVNLLLPPSYYESKVPKTLSVVKKYKFAHPFSSKS